MDHPVLTSSTTRMGARKPKTTTTTSLQTGTLMFQRRRSSESWTERKKHQFPKRQNQIDQLGSLITSLEVPILNLLPEELFLQPHLFLLTSTPLLSKTTGEDKEEGSTTTQKTSEMSSTELLLPTMTSTLQEINSRIPNQHQLLSVDKITDNTKPLIDKKFLLHLLQDITSTIKGVEQSLPKVLLLLVNLSTNTKQKTIHQPLPISRPAQKRKLKTIQLVLHSRNKPTTNTTLKGRNSLANKQKTIQQLQTTTRNQQLIKLITIQQRILQIRDSRNKPNTIKSKQKIIQQLKK